MVSFGLRNMTHKDRALSEMQRVCRPGGKVMVLEFSKVNRLLQPFYDFYSFRLMPWLGGKISNDSESYRYLAESIRVHPDQPTLAKMMEETGLENVHWHNLTFGVCALHIGRKKED
jgi:demethylmenaquinone methyltransferase/2-methoxy-6-polyprenyl-1,4-benzoquinol methylase